MKKLVYGIDFGTTNTTLAAIDKDKRTNIIPLDPTSDSPEILRSVMYFTPNGKIFFGDKAVKKYTKAVAANRPSHKEQIQTGKQIKISSDPSAKTGFKPDKIVEQMYEAEVSDVGRLLQGVKSLLGVTLLDEVAVLDKKYSIEELVSLFLAEVRQRANQFTGYNVTTAVLGRPVQFVGDSNKVAGERLASAAKQAGFTDVTLQLEPLGAAADYGISTKERHTALIFDFGGGTLDLSVVSFPEEKVVANGGIPLGGDLLNSRIFSSKIARHFGKNAQYGLNQITMPANIYKKLQNWFTISQLKSEQFAHSLETLRYKNTNPSTIDNLETLVFNNLGFSLYEEIDQLKKGLSENSAAQFQFQLQDTTLTDVLKRVEFEEIIHDDLNNIEKLIALVIKDAHVQESDLGSIVLTGGSSLIPSVRNVLTQRFGAEKLQDQDTFTSVAAGLAAFAHKTYL